MFAVVLSADNFDVNFEDRVAVVYIDDEIWNKLSSEKKSKMNVMFDKNKPFIQTKIKNLARVSAEFETIRKSN